MVFSSITFLSVFLPVVFVLHLLLPDIRIKNALLIVVSLLFYAYGEPVCIVLMLASSIFNYMIARVIAKNSKGKKIYLITGIIVNLGVLALFKYADFLVETCNQIFSTNIPQLGLVLPVGISFFTFQAMSYVMDVYWGKVDVLTSFWKVLLYISFFPPLIAGPIVKYRDINEAINNRTVNSEEMAKGFRRFICGLGKKVLIANTVGMVADHVFNASVENINILTAWIGAVAYMLQIYYDFSGYSDMAIGLGRIFGFHFKENFQYPYGAVSIQDLWRRWHISLSTWFKEYLAWCKLDICTMGTLAWHVFIAGDVLTCYKKITEMYYPYLYIASGLRRICYVPGRQHRSGSVYDKTDVYRFFFWFTDYELCPAADDTLVSCHGCYRYNWYGTDSKYS